jgi:hypothetical protein
LQIFSAPKTTNKMADNFLRHPAAAPGHVGVAKMAAELLFNSHEIG